MCTKSPATVAVKRTRNVITDIGITFRAVTTVRFGSRLCKKRGLESSEGDQGYADSATSQTDGLFLRRKGRLCPHRVHEWHDTDDLHRPFQVVGQNVQAHLGTDAWQRLRQEVRRTHPRFKRAEGVFDGLSAQA